MTGPKREAFDVDLTDKLSDQALSLPTLKNEVNFPTLTSPQAV